MNSPNISIKTYIDIQNNTKYTQSHIQCYGERIGSILDSIEKLNTY